MDHKNALLSYADAVDAVNKAESQFGIDSKQVEALLSDLVSKLDKAMKLYLDLKRRGAILPGSSEDSEFKQPTEHYSKFFFAQEQNRF